MGVDLQREQPQCGQHGGAADRHVVGGTDAGGGHVATGAPAHIGDTLLAHGTLDRHDQAVFVQHLVEAPGIAAADKDGVRLIDGINRIIEVVDADGIDSQTLLQLVGPGIPVAADHRVGDEQDALDLFVGDQALNPIPGPAEQTRKFVGFTVAKQKQFHQIVPQKVKAEERPPRFAIGQQGDRSGHTTTFG